MSRTKGIGLFLWVCLIALVRCDEPDFPASTYSRVSTLPAENVNSNGVTLRADVTFLGSAPVVNHGFFIAEEPEFDEESTLRIDLGSLSEEGEFEHVVSYGLYKDSLYHVKAFVSTATANVLGEAVTFVSKGSNGATITGFSPTEGVGGDTVLIRGHQFSRNKDRNSVQFGTYYGNVLASTDTTILCTVPPSIPEKSASVSVIVTGAKTTASGLFNLVVPVLTSISPAQVTYNDVVTILGTGFSATKEKNTVKVDGLLAEIVQAATNQLMVKVSTSLTKRENQVIVTVDARSDTSALPLVISAPTISGLSSTMVNVGATLTIQGSGFNPLRAMNQVKLDGHVATVSSVTPTSIVVSDLFPLVIDDRTFQVEVRVGEQATVAVQPVTVVDPWIRKAFFPESGANDLTASVAFTVNGMGYVHAPFSDASLRRYNPATNQWSSALPMPNGQPMYSATSFTVGSKAYLGMSLDAMRSSREFWEYDPGANSWRQVADFPDSVTESIGVSWANYGYVLTKTDQANFWRFNPDTESWDQMADFPGNTTDPWPGNFVASGGFVIGDSFYVYASDAFPNWYRLYAYSFTTNTWSQKNDIDTNALGYLTAGFSIGGNGYVMLNGELRVYDPLTDSWSSRQGIPSDKSLVFVLNDQAYVFANLTGYLFYEFDPAFP